MSTLLFESIECCRCSVIFGVTALFEKKRREDKETFWCPNGHSQAYVKSEADKLRENLTLKNQELSRKQTEIERLKIQLNPPIKKRKCGRPRKSVVEPSEEE